MNSGIPIYRVWLKHIKKYADSKDFKSLKFDVAYPDDYLKIELNSKLKDADGNWIYEGDIVKILDIPRFFWIPYDEVEETAEIVFHDGMFMVRFKINGSTELYIMNKHIKVIGNVNEN